MPVSLAYAGLAGLPLQVGIYGYLLGGLGYALFGSSRQLAVGPTSAISLMVGGTLAQMAGGDALRYGQIATLAAFTVASLSILAFLLHLSSLTNFISETVLLGFKAGAALSIASTQLPSLFGMPGGADGSRVVNRCSGVHRARGFERMEGYTLASNMGMLGPARRLDFADVESSEGPTVRMVRCYLRACD